MKACFILVFSILSVTSYVIYLLNPLELLNIFVVGIGLYYSKGGDAILWLFIFVEWKPESESLWLAGKESFFELNDYIIICDWSKIFE